jgi:hypothetical protein
MEQLAEQNCKFPCCGRTTTLQELLSLSEWASRHYLPKWYGERYHGWHWIYFHCPQCKTPCYYLPTSLVVEVGYFAAAPVPDLIPIYEISAKTAIVRHNEDIEIEYSGKIITIPHSEKW